ncbi:MAG: tetratricopeptide repeat protein [Elusimicrobia bacterium]|nr:tetratricopeptide repeat protein [Elusimicrobiota bacterium]
MTRTALFLAALVLAALPARAYDTIRFLKPISGGELSRPEAAAASADRLYVLDVRKDRMLIYGADGALLKAVGGRGSGPGRFRDPRGVAIGPRGRVYVADSGNDRVQIFDRDGGFVSQFGAKGSEPGRLRDPESLAVGVDGRIYVADTGNDRLQVFTEQGILLFAFGGKGKLPGQFRSPTRVAVDPSDDVYVLDSGNGRVQKFDASARFVRQYETEGNDFAADSYGFLYLLDGRNGKVAEVAPDGAVLGRFGSYGSGVGQLKKAEGIAIAPDGTLIVLDTGNDRVLRAVMTDKLKTTPLPLNSRTKMTVTGPSRAWPVAATALAAYGDSLYAYLPKGGPFVVVGPDGQIEKRFGKEGKGESDTRAAAGIAASASLGFFASDPELSRLQRFTLDGEWKSDIGEKQGFFDSRSKEGRVDDPRGVAVNDKGTVYVADAGNRRVDAFSPQGVFLFAIGPKLGSFDLQKPVALAWDPGGFLYFVDAGLRKVFKVEPSGALVASWGEEGDGPGRFESPASIAFDGENYLYVLDSALRRVSVFTKDGNWLTDFFAGGDQERELERPVALAVQGQKLVIADAGRASLVSYDLHPQLAAPAEISTSTKQGIVSLSWQPVADSWTDSYEVYRASEPAGPYAEVASVDKPAYQDSDVASYETYWYRVATRAKTKDLGPWSLPVPTFVSGEFNRAPIEISSITLGNVFAAKYKWYLTHPAGSMSVTNNVNVPFLNVKATFKLKDYMDFGFDTVIDKLEPKQTVEIPLIATLNNKVLDVTEDTPIQAEFKLSYYENGQAREVTLTKPLRLYSRNAITWDDPRKLASFITYKDDPVKAFKPVVAASYESRPARFLNGNALTALKLWDALGAYGLKYAANPANPFETAHDDPSFPVDYTQYPRETLQRKTGQCSDLASLYAALLEDNDVPVALLDYPGHITLMLDTGAADPAEAGLPADLLVQHDGTMWLPVEVTYVGRPFLDAVSKAAYAYRAEADKGRVKIYDVDAAFREYEPVTMPPSSFAPVLPPAAELEKAYDAQVGELAKARYKFLKGKWEEAERAGDPAARFQLGVVEYQYGDLDAAEKSFGRVLALKPDDALALGDLGAISFLRGDYAQALLRFEKSTAADPGDADVWLNLVKTAVKLKQGDQARAYGAKAVALDPGYQPYVDALVQGL